MRHVGTLLLKHPTSNSICPVPYAVGTQQFELLRVAMILRTQLTSYTEDESFQCTGAPEPYIRSHNVLFYSNDSTWHVKVTFNSEVLRANPDTDCIFARKPVSQKSKRREEFRSFLQTIDFSSLKLLDDTVTEVELRLELQRSQITDATRRHIAPAAITRNCQENRFMHRSCFLRRRIRQDKSRIIYPTYIDGSPWPPQISYSDIQVQDNITGSAVRVQVLEDKTSFVYKKVDRPFYLQKDTKVILKELHNLKHFRGNPYIAQLRAVVVSTNPYQTKATACDQPVLRGILLEYYPGGTLEQWLEGEHQSDLPWRRWPLQIGHGLHSMHSYDSVHMDVKPSNIVFDADGNAKLIDISGIGGVTYDWLAPELRSEDERAFTFKAQKLNDIWAYGKTLQKIAERMNRIENVEWLIEVATKIVNSTPESRIGLPDVLSSIHRLSSGD